MASIIAGSAVGAVIRYAIFEAWSAPVHLLTATVVSGIFGFAIAGFAFAADAGPEVRAFVAGVAGAIMSVSAYLAFGISQPPWVALAFVLLSPLSIIAGLIIGGFLGVSMKTRGARAPK